MTLSEDGQWMWDGSKWIPAPPGAAAAPPTPAAAPSPTPGFSDPNTQSWDSPQPFGGQPMMDPNPGGWAPDGRSASGSSSIPMAVIITVVVLVVGGATGGILWATGVFGSSSDDLVGVWYEDNSRDGLQFKENGDLVMIDEGSPDYDDDEEWTWSVSGDKLTVTAISHYLTDDEFECNDGEEIPRYYVNDGDEDCDDGEDEGVDVTQYPHETETQVVVFLFDIDQNVLFLGILSATYEGDGYSQTTTIDEGDICSDRNGECMAYVNADAMNNLNHQTVVSGASAPDWFENSYDDYYDWY